MESRQLNSEVNGLYLSDDKFVIFATEKTRDGTAASFHPLVDIQKAMNHSNIIHYAQYVNSNHHRSLPLSIVVRVKIL